MLEQVYLSKSTAGNPLQEICGIDNHSKEAASQFLCCLPSLLGQLLKKQIISFRNIDLAPVVQN